MRTRSIVPTILLAFFFAVDSFAADEKVEPKDLPAKVAEAIKARFPKGEIEKCTKEMEDGKVIYDIELKVVGVKYESDILEDGTIVEIEKEVTIKDLPKAVAKALAKAVTKKYPKANVKEVMEKSLVKDGKETPHEYEIVIFTTDRKSLELTISLDGEKIEDAKGE